MPGLRSKLNTTGNLNPGLILRWELGLRYMQAYANIVTQHRDLGTVLYYYFYSFASISFCHVQYVRSQAVINFCFSVSEFTKQWVRAVQAMVRSRTPHLQLLSDESADAMTANDNAESTFLGTEPLSLRLLHYLFSLG